VTSLKFTQHNAAAEEWRKISYHVVKQTQCGRLMDKERMFDKKSIIP
jgi:hypothetical protein